MWRGLDTGFVDIALGSKTPGGGHTVTSHKFFDVAFERDDLIRHVGINSDRDVYFTPTVYSKPIRSAEDAQATTSVLYADLDTFHPDDLRVRPSIAVESSAGRYQAFWVLSSPVPQAQAARVSMKIGKAHNLDASSGIATKLLRIPGTTNTKYEVPFTVEMLWAEDEQYALEDIDRAYADIVSHDGPSRVELETPADLPDPWDVMARIPAHSRIEWLLEWDKDTADDPEKRSEHRYELIRLLLEKTDLSPVEIASVVWQSKLADHYREQSRPFEHFWKFDMTKALGAEVEPDVAPVVEQTEKAVADFLTADELQVVFENPGFMERWRNMAYQSLHPNTPPQYVTMNGYVYLAATIGNRVMVIAPGTKRAVFCNLYTINLGPTTTGKSEALFHLKRYISAFEVKSGQEIVVGNDATSEGLLKALRNFNDKSAMLITDEVSRKFRDWQTSPAKSAARETELEIYDGHLPRNLRATDGAGQTEKVEVAFTNYMMGVGDTVASILDRSFLRSGYIPRCLVVLAERPEFDPDEHMNMEQGTVEQSQLRDPEPEKWAERLFNVLEEKRGKYHHDGRYVMQFEADAWVRFLQFRTELLLWAESSEDVDTYKPHAIRFAVSCQKMMALLAMERRADKIDMLDVLRVLADAEDFWRFTVDLIRQVSESEFARMQAEVLEWLDKTPSGKKRLTEFHEKWQSLALRDREDLLTSLTQRGLIRVEKGRPSMIHMNKKEVAE